jgi:nucleoid DNA-binding protein
MTSWVKGWMSAKYGQYQEFEENDDVAIHQKLNIPQKDAAHILEVVISVLKESLADKQTIKIAGFGTLINPAQNKK